MQKVLKILCQPNILNAYSRQIQRSGFSAVVSLWKLQGRLCLGAEADQPEVIWNTPEGAQPCILPFLSVIQAWTNTFSPTRPHLAELVIESPCPSVCLCVCLFAPSSAVFFEASHWPSGHMTRSRPLIGQPPPAPP